MMEDIWSHVQKGMFHVLNLDAYDHILFIIVITVPFLFNKWKRVLALISLFALGHGISLALATYGIVKVNNSLVEFLIGMTILIVALYNVFTSGKKPESERIGISLIASIFFGIVHGFGFAGLFNGLRDAKHHKLIGVLEHVVGIELGQLLVAFLILFISFLCQTIFRFSKRDWVLVWSSIVIGLLIPMLLNSNYL